MSLTAVKQQLELLLKFLEPLLNFSNCHMVDFFTQSSYEAYIPTEIQKELEQIGLESAVDYIFENNFNKTPHLGNFVENSLKFTLRNVEFCLNFNNFVDKLKSWGCDNIDRFKLEVFMNAKKSHEVEILSAVVAAVSNLSKANYIVDIGDGKGYLSSMLALHNKLSVLGIDASNVNTCGAIKRATKLSKIWNNLPNDPHKSHPKKSENYSTSNINLYKQVTEFVDENFDLKKLVAEVFQQPESLRLGLVGLHTCGNLASNSLKIFVKNNPVKSICNVGCCYHLITERFVESESCNSATFPMSKFLCDKKISIGRSAKMIANQSVERILHSKELPNISIFYRALLQVILSKYCTEIPTKHVGKFRKTPDNFVTYVRLAMKRLDMNLDITDDEIEEIYKRYKSRVNELNVFYLLRGKLSPLIESLILLDRLLFLKEEGYENSFLVQLFDPVVSPRCYGIVALKEIV